MPNDILTPDVIAKRAVATLYNNIVLAPLVYRDFEPEFAGKQGDTITVRTPATFTPNVFDRTQGIQVQDIDEGAFTVSLDTLLDTSVEVTSEELTLEIDDFQERVLNPIMEGFAQEIDGRIAECLVDTAEGAGGGGTADGTASPNAAFRTARARLGRAKLPLSERYVVLSPEAVSDVLGDDLLVCADASGSTDALIEANLGRKFGFEFYESQVFGHGTGDRGQADGVAFHKSAVALTTRTLALPMGADASRASVVNYKGLGLRVIYGYNQQYKKDVLSVDLLCGVAAVTGRKAGVVQIDLGQGS